MCGINGLVYLGQQHEAPASIDNRTILTRMNNTIAHRGPDSDGLFVKKGVGLGFRRLSIIDLSTSANQPMVSDDGEVILIFNGEIYNYIEVKATLQAKGYSFRTDSDTEVILKSYLEYGTDCVQHFNGMWALAIYDFRNNRLFCSRDRLGVKPFYYSVKDQHLYFSSELKALHAVLNFSRANLSKVYEYLAYGYRNNDGETFYEDCNELLPGTNLIVQLDKIEFQKYWTLKENLYQHDPGLNPYEAFTQLFENAVKLRYRSDVPVALLLSGGLDSSSIARVTDNLIQSGALGQNEIHAFIASFPNYKDDETPIAQEFVKTCKHIRLHEMLVDTQRTVAELENTIYALDHPVFSFNVVVHNNIMRACKDRGLKVVLNGQGSDEAFAGYDRYIAGVHLVDQLLHKNRNFLQEFNNISKLNHYSKAFLLSQMFKSVIGQNTAAYLRARYQEKSIPYLDKAFVKDHYDHYEPQYQFSLQGNNLTNYLLKQINKEGLNQILHYEDVSSMSQSIEIRSPFMDYRLMEFAFSIPNELKFKDGVTKRIVRETIGKTLPDSIAKNRRKIGFGTPFLDYLSNDPAFRTYVQDVINSTHFGSKNIWNASKIREVFANPAQNASFPFWRVLNLAVWAQKYQVTNL